MAGEAFSPIQFLHRDCVTVRAYRCAKITNIFSEPDVIAVLLPILRSRHPALSHRLRNFIKQKEGSVLTIEAIFLPCDGLNGKTRLAPGQNDRRTTPLVARLEAARHT